MNKRILLSLLLALSMVFSLTACGGRGDTSAQGDASAEGSASISSEELQESEPEEEEALDPFGLGYYRGVGINPYDCDNSQNQTIGGLVYEPLFELDEHFQPIPCLAESVSAEVRKTGSVPVDQGDGEESGGSGEDKGQKSTTAYATDITIQLRDDVTFSDGSSMDASDVVYSLEQATAKDSIYYGRLSGVTSLSQGGSSTVYLTIQGANTNVAAILDIPIVKYGTGDDLFPIGTGPYVPKRDKNGLPKRLVANSGWWQLDREYEEEVPDPNSTEGSDRTMVVTKTMSQPVEEIKIYAATDSDELIFGFSSANISVVSSDMTGINALDYTGSYTVTDYATSNLIYLGCNTKEGACKEQKLRSAVYRSLDRENIVSRMLAGHGEAAAMPISPSAALYDQKLAEELDYDLSKAQELCGQANPGSTLRLIVNSNSSFKVAMAQEIGKELESAGLSVTVETLSWKEYRQALQEGAYDLYLGEVKLNGNFDLTRLIHANGSLNYSGYYNEDLMKKSRAFNCASEEERGEAASDFYTALAEQAPIVPICFKTYSLLSREGYLLNQHPTQQNLFYRFWDWTFTSEAVEASRLSS